MKHSHVAQYYSPCSTAECRNGERINIHSYVLLLGVNSTDKRFNLRGIGFFFFLVNETARHQGVIFIINVILVVVN